MSDRHVAEMLDEACRTWVDMVRDGRQPTELHVNPLVYQTVLDMREEDLARGNPLTLLGLDLMSADDVAPSRPRLA